jgi:CheY-like chemotaxis protein
MTPNFRSRADAHALGSKPHPSSGALLELIACEADMTLNAHPAEATRQLAVFVGGGTDALAVVEPVLDGRSYAVEFVEADDEPYATIAALKPDLIVVSLALDDLGGFQLLTMLRLDPNTARIPVLSYVRDADVSTWGPAGVDASVPQLPAVTASRAQRH